MQKLKQDWGIVFLIVLALLYLVPYFFLVRHEEKKVVEIYFADRVTEAHRILIDRYNRMHAGSVQVIPIDFQNSDFSTNERKEILARSLRGEGDGIDLLAVDVIWVQRFARWCEPLDAYFSKEELRRIIPDALYSCYSDSQLVAVPLDMVQGVLYYREDLLRKARGGEHVIAALQGGLSWAQFVSLKSTLNWNGPFYMFPAAEYEGMICSYIEILLGIEPEYFEIHGFDFRTPEASHALRLLVDLLHKDQATPIAATSFTEVPSYRYFIEHDGLFLHGWVTYDRDFVDAPVDREKESHLRKAPLPYVPDGRPASVFGGWDLMIPKISPKKEAVIDFVKYLLTEESQEIFYTKGSYYPVISSFYEDSAYAQKYPEIRTIKQLMKTGVHRPPHKDYTKFSKIMAHYIFLALKNRLAVDEAVERMTRDIESETIMAGIR